MLANGTKVSAPIVAAFALTRSPMTFQQAKESLVYRRNKEDALRLKGGFHTYAADSLLDLRGAQLGAGIETVGYSVVNCPDFVMLVTRSRGGDTLRFTHAIKVLQLAAAGVLVTHAYARVAQYTHPVSVIITLATEDCSRGNVAPPIRTAIEELMANDEFHHCRVPRAIAEARKIAGSGGGSGGAIVRSLAAQFVEVYERIVAVHPEIASAINSAHSDGHGGNWRQLPNGRIYLADGFVIF